MGPNHCARRSFGACRRDSSGPTAPDLLEFFHLRLGSSPLSTTGSLTLDNVDAWEGAVEQSPKLQLTRTILNHTDFRESLRQRSAVIADPHVFNTEIEFKTGPITSQKSSGRCWLFATTNVLRHSVMKKLDLDDFQLSQWDMAVNLVEVSFVPESTHSSLSSPLNSLLKTSCASMHSFSATSLFSPRQFFSIEEAINLTLRLHYHERDPRDTAKPDAPFTWDYYTKDGKPMSWTGTPKEFYAASPPADSFSLINDPRNEYSKLYTVDKLGNLWARALCSVHVNTEIENLKQAVIRQIKAGHPVFFGCDVGKCEERNMGLLDTDVFAYEAAFDISFGLSKADRLRMQESQMTHAMVITAVHLDGAGRPVRYKVENSWGPEPGNGGWFVMTDKWFEQFVYQVVVPKALAPKDLVAVFEGRNARSSGKSSPPMNAVSTNSPSEAMNGGSGRPGSDSRPVGVVKWIVVVAPSAA
ncbi:peptidase C1B bleomycin hydrolase [Epithele typhae]|uniref:peptidase C1B bleomycin hydrolase n=1 Tax=Epithele typhae TaxID=378194 RepID=UPI002008B3E3|nr:peptidase C1B bleomycin hydrolase [Epithele typhae]KAH9931126.1 peptidase C1B bleomycin hydrolase [Epithele typhae]